MDEFDEFKYGDAVFHPGDYIIYQNGDSNGEKASIEAWNRRADNEQD